MAKRGGSLHTKRLAISKAIPISDKKEKTFMMTALPGPHPKERMIPLGVLMRDVLRFTRTSSENRIALNSGSVSIDGKVRKKQHFPVGFMDAVSFAKAGKFYRILVNKKGQLVPVEIKEKETSSKMAKVVGKQMISGGKITIALHDGRTLIADNKVNVGDTVIISVPDQKLMKVIPLKEGATCFITEGKHAGSIAKLEKIISRQEGRAPEAKLSGKDSGEFVTVAKYLFMIDDSFQGASQ